MIKFFRRLRQSLLSENKVSKYFLYAIGEIILVVIGILIAVQINNWNNKSEENNKSIAFLNRVVTELNLNIQEVDKQIKTETSQKESSKLILSFFNFDYSEQLEKQLDSLMYIIILGNYLDLSTSTMEEGFNSGQVALVESEGIRKSLYNIKTKFADTEQAILKGNIDMRNNLLPYLYDNYNWRRMDYSNSHSQIEIGQSSFTSTNKALLKSLKFENLIDNRYWSCNQQVQKLESLKKELNGLKTLINNYLSQQ